jgi:hypothetical protein
MNLGTHPDRTTSEICPIRVVSSVDATKMPIFFMYKLNLMVILVGIFVKNTVIDTSV